MPVGENRIVKAYCDCSGKTESGSPFLTLACYFATGESWHHLEREWNKALKNRSAPYFHAREAISLKVGYKEWNAERVTRLVQELFNVLGKMDRDDFFGASCTVDLKEYAKAKESIPRLRKPEEICLDHCMGMIFRHPRSDHGIELFFDRDESFRG